MHAPVPEPIEWAQVMSRIRKLLRKLASPLLLTACVPLDAVRSDPQGSAGAGETAFPSEDTTPETTKDLPFQISPADGLDQRISALHELSIAYRLHGGEHAVDYAVPGREECSAAANPRSAQPTAPWDSV